MTHLEELAGHRSVLAGKPLAYHWLRLRAACHATEDPDKVKAALRTAAGVAELVVKETRLDSHHGGAIVILEATLDTARPIRDCLARILALPGAQADLAASLDARTDDDGVFHLRLDKQEAAQGRLALTRGEDAVQVRLKMHVHPASREKALEALSTLLAGRT